MVTRHARTLRRQANSIESVELKADGGVKVKLTSKLTARRIILEQTGKLKSTVDSFDALADAIRSDVERHGRPNRS